MMRLVEASHELVMDERRQEREQQEEEEEATQR